MKPTPSAPLVGAFTLASTIACLLLALWPAVARADDGFDAARGRYELSDGRTVYLAGTPRRPVLMADDGSRTRLAPLRDGTTAAADGHLVLHVVAAPNGIVTGIRLTQRRAAQEVAHHVP